MDQGQFHHVRRDSLPASAERATPPSLLRDLPGEAVLCLVPASGLFLISVVAGLDLLFPLFKMASQPWLVLQMPT